MEIVWNSRYDTGIRSIDLQHRELVEMINALKNLNRDRHDTSELNSLLQRLDQYVIFHFGHEETLMSRRAVAAEHRQKHASEHSAFALELNARVARVTEGVDWSEVEALAEYLRNWLLDHILKTDLELARCLAEHPFLHGPSNTPRNRWP